ncbi:MAG: glycosyltransferase family 4 protein [Planctomycetota bacterium]
MNQGFTFVLPGSLQARTGGTIYDRRIVEGSRKLSTSVAALELEGAFPYPSREAKQRAVAVFAALPDGTVTVVDGLAFGALPELAEAHGERLRLIALVHHPLADEDEGDSDGLLSSERRALRHARGAVATSPFTAKRLRALELLPPELPVEVVEPGVDAAPLSATWDPSGIRDSDARAAEPLRLLSIGSLTPRKAHATAAAALLQLDPRLPWEWTVAGRCDLDQACAASVRHTLAQESLAQRTRLIESPSDAEVRELYSRSHVLLHPARYEGFGMAVTEALASGLPVIASDGGALPGTLTAHGSRGRELAGAIFPAGDAGALAARLHDLMTTPGRWAGWRATAEHARRKLPGWDASTEAFLGALQRLAGSLTPPTQ